MVFEDNVKNPWPILEMTLIYYTSRAYKYENKQIVHNIGNICSSNVINKNAGVNFRVKIRVHRCAAFLTWLLCS